MDRRESPREGTTPRCERCGADLADARRGTLCPRCLLALGLPDPDSADGVEGLPTASVLPAAGGDAARPARASFTGPRRVAGYDIVRQLGAGGMGTVFEAVDVDMDRRVALKVLSFRLDGSDKAARRFENEAWIAGRLDHPNLVKVFERGSHEGLAYYSMELVDGGSIHDVIDNLRRWGRDDSWGLEFGNKRYIDWALDKVISAARALDYAHRQGVVHRDVKPMNLLLSREHGTLKIADFGLALDSEATRITATGDVMGTLSYMAPEQLLAKRDEIDARTDVYALGVTLFELLTLQLPHESDTREGYMHSVLTDAARRARTLNQRVSRDLETVIGRALEKRPRDRYPSAAALADDLDRVRHLMPIEARRPGPLERLHKWARRRPAHAVLAATLIVAVPLTAVLGTRAMQHRRLVRERTLESLEQRMRFLDQRARFDDLMQVADSILEIEPNHRMALRARGIAALELALSGTGDRAGLESRALADFGRIVELRPDSSGAYRLKQYALDKLGHAEEAREAGQRAEQLRLAVPSDDDLEVEGFLAEQRGEFASAVEVYSELIARDPRRLQPLEMRARAWERLGRIDEAIEDYRVFSAISPDLFRGRFELGRLYTAAGELDLGERQFREALAIRPEDAHTYEGLAYNAIAKAQSALSSEDEAGALEGFATAEGCARRSIEIDPDSPDAHMNLGISLVEQSRLLEAAPEYKTTAARQYQEAARLLVGLNATGGDAYLTLQVNLCDLLIEIGDYDHALETCVEVTRLDPGFAAAHYNIAAIHALAGRSDEAFAALERDLASGDTDDRYLATDPWFDAVRDDPRFADVLGRMRAAASHESADDGDR